MKITFIIAEAAERIDFFGKSVGSEAPAGWTPNNCGRVLIAGELGADVLPAIAAYAASFNGVYLDGSHLPAAYRQNNRDEFFAVIDDCLNRRQPLQLSINDPLAFLIETTKSGANPPLPKTRLGDWRAKWRQIIAAAPADWTLLVGINSVAEMALLPEGESSFRLFAGEEDFPALSPVIATGAARQEIVPEINLIFLSSSNDPLRRLFNTSGKVDLMNLKHGAVACRFPGDLWIESDTEHWFKR